MNTIDDRQLDRLWRWLALALLAVYVRGLFIDLMDVDAAQYASIAMEMLHHGHWLEVQYRFSDYLDKPPLLFWTAALSFAVFGLHAWAYKLPSLIGAAAGAFAVYRFCLLYYPRRVARNAVFILASAVGAVLMCNDVRTDALLFGMTAIAVWQCAEYVELRHTRYLVGAGTAVGLAMLAKGPLGAVMPAFAVGTQLVLRRDWRTLLTWRWLIAVAVAAVVLLPMCWGLYHQFDMHPAKLVLGRTHVSGLRFFFWEQSFGRVTGSSPWKNDTSLFTFVHVFLWVFLPWTLLFLGGLWRRLADLVRDGFRIAPGDEAYSLGGFALTFVALSLSHYKLPHYIFITLPWAAVLTARWLAAAPRRPWWFGQYVVLAALLGAAAWILAVAFPTTNAALWAVIGVAGVYLLINGWRAPSRPNADVLVQRTLIAGLATLIVVNFEFYPRLLPYQSTIRAPAIARTAGVATGRLAFYHQGGPALDFYAGAMLVELRTVADIRQHADSLGPFWLYTDAVGRARLDTAGVRYTTMANIPHFEVALLTGRFLIARTRGTALTPRYWLRVASKTAGSP